MMHLLVLFSINSSLVRSVGFDNLKLFEDVLSGDEESDAGWCVLEMEAINFK